LLAAAAFVLGILAAVAAAAYFWLRGKRPTPHLEGGATIESLETRQT
jgi:hypothetical protein